MGRSKWGRMEMLAGEEGKEQVKRSITGTGPGGGM
jgi:hypothetical protein